MLKMKKRWKVKAANKELQEVLGRKLEILPLTAQLLINRGLVDCDKAFSFLRPELKNLHDPFLLKGMDRAAERIILAIEKRERVAVYGDYDVDGTTSTALLYLFFKEIGVDVTCYIPQRQTEGYGMNCEAVKKLSVLSINLIITVDCGSSNHDEINYANSLGIDVIVTDHHEFSKEPPAAYAVVNPKQKDCAFPFKNLAGVGVAFNLLMGIRSRLRSMGWFKNNEPNLKKYLDIVSIGTVADIVPLVDENRIFVSYGLRELENTRRPGLKALMDSVGIKPGKLDADSIAFQIAPRINAAGRLTQAITALRLLITDDIREAESLADTLNKENASRQKIEGSTLEEAMAMLGDSTDKGIVLFSEGWHPGVIGIVASRLVDRFGKPAVMISIDGDIGKGSARGIKSFNILEGLSSCSGLLERFGGHKAAAGLTIARENLEQFRLEFLEYLNDKIADEDLTPEIELDAEVSLGDITGRQIAEIESLSPFGCSNSEPLLCAAGADILQTEIVGTRHLRFKVKQNGSSWNGIGFNLARMHPISGEGFHIAFSPYVDEWQGTKSLRLRIRDIQATA